MSNQPYALTKKEINELATFEGLQSEWGMGERRLMKALCNSLSAKFKSDGSNDCEMTEVFLLSPRFDDYYVSVFKIGRTTDGKLRILGEA